MQLGLYHRNVASPRSEATRTEMKELVLTDRTLKVTETRLKTIQEFLKGQQVTFDQLKLVIHHEHAHAVLELGTGNGSGFRMLKMMDLVRWCNSL